MYSFIISEKVQVTVMVRYELKKIFGSFGGKVTLVLYAAVVVLSCWLAAAGELNVGSVWVNEQGSRETGPAAVKKMQAARAEWTGWLNQDMLTRAVQENARINATPQAQSNDVRQNDIAFGWKQGFDPIRELINRSYSPGFRHYDYYTADGITAIDEHTFYSNRVKLVREWLNDKSDVGESTFTQQEKDYIISQYESLQTPFYMEYHDGWYQLLENGIFIPMLGILILSFALSGIFSGEFKWRADALYFSTTYGRTKGTSAKIKAGLLLITLLYWAGILVYSLFTLTYLGFGGGNTVIQVRLWKSLYNITMRQAWVLAVSCGYIGNLFLGILTMLISAKTKSAAVAVSMPFIVIFIPVILQGTVDALSTFASLMPSTLLEFYQHLSTFDLVTVFGKVFRVADLCIPLYGLLTLILIPILYREYRTKQIV